MDSADDKRKDIPLYCMYQGPGPAYNLRTCIGMKNHCPTLKQGPAYSIGHRTMEKHEEKPGPIYWYDPKLTSHGKVHVPACYIAGRPKNKPSAESLPGPGDYDLTKTKTGILSNEHRAPKISIGQRPKWTEKSNAPPPNKYDVTTGIGTRSQTAPIAPSWSIGTRTDFGSTSYMALKGATPGPANYSTVKPGVYKPSHNGFSIQGRTAQKQYISVRDNPGPNTYDPQNAYKHLTKKNGFTMGIKHSKYVMPLIDTTIV
ncbi:hypothetical protein HELRODRAFT_175268 [Helobdella robusta]|uniref:Outer dense fiber protein 3 n=1 Tax=Helobdella robusta TaxID=6412 RepID=T1F928_HELRO|nr:hypothetical protein HELRODRAFT_175268 [Helobdella robusta]ESO00787.1 hypothetical protein HELRODRAFT_175268 [Helobdella robusta]